MIYVVDRNTNRIIFHTDNEAGYALDPYTYRFDAPPYPFQESSWFYKVVNDVIVHAPAKPAKAAVPAVHSQPTK